MSQYFSRINTTNDFIGFYDINSLSDEAILMETNNTITKIFTPTTDMKQSTYKIEQIWYSYNDEHIYGLGMYQNGLIDFKNCPLNLLQFDTGR